MEGGSTRQGTWHGILQLTGHMSHGVIVLFQPCLAGPLSDQSASMPPLGSRASPCGFARGMNVNCAALLFGLTPTNHCLVPCCAVQAPTFGIKDSRSILEQRQSLPIYKLKDQLVQAVIDNQVCMRACRAACTRHHRGVHCWCARCLA